MKRVLFSSVLATIVVVACLGQQTRTISLDDLIPKGQQEKIGIQKLSAEEREALRQHILALLVAAAYAQASHPSEVAKPAESQLPLQTQAASRKPSASSFLEAPRVSQPRMGRTYVATGESHWIKENIDSGGFILLDDGSLWEIDPLDKIDAILWLSTSSVTVVESSSGSPGYDYMLINTDDGEKAHAKFIANR